MVLRVITTSLENIFNGDTSIEKVEEDQEQFRFNLNEVARWNSKNKSKEQLTAIKILKIFIVQEKQLSNYIMIMPELCLTLDTKQNMEPNLKC